MPDPQIQAGSDAPSLGGVGLVPPSGGVAFAPPSPPEYAGGWSVPDMGGAYQQTLQAIEVDKALRAIDASEQWLAQRGYQSDLQDGMSAAAAFTKWAPSLFRSGSGMADAMNLQQPPSAMDKANLAYRNAQTDKLKAIVPPKPTIRANAEGQLVSIMPDGKVTTLDATKKRVPPPRPVMFPLDLGTEEKPEIKMFSAENAEALLNGNRMPDNAVNGATRAAIIARKSAGTNALPGGKADAVGNQLAGVKAGTAANPVKPAPAKDQRVKDTIYQTPKGPMTWTGEGWLPPAPEAAQ